ncbi:MAG TPA: helix-turn-helix transcriptional regulator [Candidatus Binatia bacterium]|nr:helix-turn-helix transcriptional regulator [Candidatus Binatia bacterium]
MKPATIIASRRAAGLDSRGRPLRRGRQLTGRCLRCVPRGEGMRAWQRLLGAQIQHVRESLGVPVSELAAACGCWEQTLHHIEAGRGTSLARLKQIADALGVLVADLMPRAI